MTGRRFVEYLRGELARERAVCDKQYFSLRLHPHTQIEVYSSFNPHVVPGVGPYIEVITIQFNKYLDYYDIVHFTRPRAEGKPSLKAAQLMFYYELTSITASRILHLPAMPPTRRT